MGVPDPEWGENVCAVVVPSAGATVDPDALVAAARARLAGFKVPRHVVTVDELPKNSTGQDREAGDADVARRASRAPGRPPVGSGA